MRRLLLLLLACCLCLTTPAQRRNRQQRKPTQKEQLQTRQKKLRQQRQANQQRQRELELQVKQRMQDVEALGSDIDDNKLIIDSLRQEADTLNRHIAVIDSQLNMLKSELEERRQHYIKSLRYMYRNRNAQNRIMFVLSSQNFNQMYRRLRFMNEYTTYQKAQGEAVKQKSEQVTAKLSELNDARIALSALVDSSENQQRQLEARQAEQQRMVADLQRQQQTVKKLIVQQQREEAEINRQIERIIAEELEKARKAEEERQQRLAEQRRRQQEQQAQQQAQQNQQQSRRRNRRGNSNSRNSNNTPTAPAYSPADPDRQLTGNFANNKGRMPVPITGSYRIVRGFGSYTLAGVTLQSSGIQLQGQEGAKARCVFDGEVSRVYNPGSGYYVMVRHGRYITVYGNLSSVNVSAGQHVSINQSIGTVGTGLILIFRLQNWNQPLNPKKWLKRL